MPNLEASIKLELPDSVQQALIQVDDDSLFGTCVLCRRPIAERRLRQLPWAAYCNACDPRDGKQDNGFEISQAA